jgi:hypothetical protein
MMVKSKYGIQERRFALLRSKNILAQLLGSVSFQILGMLYFRLRLTEQCELLILLDISNSSSTIYLIETLE